MLKTIASILDVYANIGNQEYYNRQAESVTSVIEAIVQDRDNKNLHGAILLGLKTTTFPDFNKTNNLFWDKPNKRWLIVKQTHLTVIIGFDYTRAVNNRRAKEGLETDFVSLPRQWGTHIPGTPFVEHINKEGVYRKYLSVACSPAVPKITYYSVSPFAEVNQETIQPYIKEKQITRQGVENELVYRDYACDSINEIHYRGTFELRDILRELRGEFNKSL